MSRITFNVAARCDKAGRSQNQDNFWICPNLEKIDEITSVGNDTDIELSSKGALMVVADGMGGMKSGEKASEFVIEGIKKQFSDIPENILNDDEAIISFMKNAIVYSDQLIKNFAKEHRESEGMGSTVVMVWLLGEKAYCGWCGDSRIYCYNPQNSLIRLSHDHSYVQSLVDEGKIPEEDAFEHPDGNIITRSLGDSGESVAPEFKIYSIHRRDVFLLCSDGLCGLLRDDKLESVLSENCTSSEDALKHLWYAGENKGWADNTTIEVACIIDGGKIPTRKAVGYNERLAKSDTPKPQQVRKDTNITTDFWQSNKQYIIVVVVVTLIALCIIWLFSKGKNGYNNSNIYSIESTENVDTHNSNIHGNQGSPQNSNNNIGTGSNGGNTQNAGSHNNGHNPNGTPNNNGGNHNNGNSSTNTNSINGNTNNNNGVQGNYDPNKIQEQINNQQTIRVSKDYLELLGNTYNSINVIRTFITNAQSRRHFTSAEANALKDFIENTRNLNSLPDVKVLDQKQKEILRQINNTSENAGKALRYYKVYDDEDMRPNGHPRRGQNDPWRGQQNSFQQQEEPNREIGEYSGEYRI